jgi:hypothetical protein
MNDRLAEQDVATDPPDNRLRRIVHVALVVYLLPALTVVCLLLAVFSALTVILAGLGHAFGALTRGRPRGYAQARPVGAGAAAFDAVQPRLGAPLSRRQDFVPEPKLAHWPGESARN